MDLVPLLLTTGDIPVYRTNFTCRRAHQWLPQHRANAAHRGMEVMDLSDSPTWRPYVCSHPKAREIIGEGIVRFEGRFLRSVEPNHVQLGLPPPFGQHRFDFIAVRGDGRACRMHPGARRDAEIIVGLYDSWLMQPSASTPGPGQPSASTPGIMRRAGLAYENYNQTDIISGKSALGMLMDMYHAHMAAGGVQSSMRVDVLAMPGNFEWPRFLMGRPWGRTLVAQGIAQLHLVWRDEEGVALRVETSTAETRHIVFRGDRACLLPT